jgi:hypothetical protein
MKDMIKTLADSAKSNPKDFIASVAVVLFIFLAMWAATWIEAIMNGKV